MVALVDDADYEWLNQWKWCAHKYTGCRSHYADRRDYTVGKGKTGKGVKMHRLIMGLTDPKMFVDHRDQNGLNNQRDNLRIATRSQNAANRSPWKIATSRYMGVSKKKLQGKKPWHAQITVKGRTRSLGCYANEIDAAMAYNKAALEFHGEFANPNKIAV